MPDQLPSGRWRGRVRHPRTGKQINPAVVLGGPTTFNSKTEAAAAERDALKHLRLGYREGTTIGEWRDEWLNDPLWQRSESTMIHYAERTRAFALEFGHLPMRRFGDLQVARWLKGGNRTSTVPKLRIMWNDAMSAPAGRIVDRNPWVGLRLRGSRGRRDVQPPSQAAVAGLVDLADELTPFTFAAWVDVAIHTGMRPGELDALAWDRINFQAGTILVDQQWNTKTRSFTAPKYGARTIALTTPAADRLLTLPRESEWAFTTLNGSHYTPSARSFHWNRVRAAAGIGNTDLYTCTRHYFGWYAFNILELPDHVIARQFGHQDGGKLVRTVYGHPDEKIALEKIRAAYRNPPTPPTPIRRAQLS